MKFIFLGSGKIAEKCLEKILTSKYENIECVGLSISAELRKKLNLNESNFEPGKSYFDIDPLNRQESNIKKLIIQGKPKFIVSVQYPWILSKEIINLLDGRVINLHNAKLPSYRGHNTISHEILNNENTHTSTLHWISEEVDRGLIVMEKTFSIEKGDTAYSLWSKSVRSSLGLLDKFFLNCEKIVLEFSGELVSSGGQYYSKKSINKLKEIPLKASRQDISRISRAFCFPPHEPAYFKINDRKYYVIPKDFKYETRGEI